MEEASRWVRRCCCCYKKEEESEENRGEPEEEEEEVKIEEVCLRKSRSSLSLPPAQVGALTGTPPTYRVNVFRRISVQVNKKVLKLKLEMKRNIKDLSKSE